MLDALEAKGLLRRPASAEEREALVNEAAMTVASPVDEMLRDLAVRRLAEFRPELGRALVGEAIDALLGRVEPAAVARKPTPAEREALIEPLAKTYGDRLAVRGPARRRDRSWSATPPGGSSTLGVLRDRPDLLTPPPAPLERAAEAVGDVLGFAKPTLVHADRRAPRRRPRAPAQGADEVAQLGAVRPRRRRRQLGGPRRAVEARPRPEAGRRETRPRRSLQALRAALEKPFADRLLLWKKTKNDLVEEMSTALQMPGWGNSFTQPIANRIEMLSTGVRLPVAVKVFGSKLDDIQRVSQEIAAVLRGVRGAADVFPDQIVGKGYVEIKIDRKKAARYGINVGDIQDVVEVAMGGRPLTMTVEGRERYPVRVRYARDYRDDVEALKGILVSARAGWRTPGTGPAAWAGWVRAMPSPARPPRVRRVQIPLAAVADVRVVEGPSMIKSENGLLRSYIQLRVRDRDEVGFVEEAQRVVAEKVRSCPPGCTSNGRARSSTRSGPTRRCGSSSRP